MICRAINLAGEVSADLSSPTNEAVACPPPAPVAAEDGSRLFVLPVSSERLNLVIWFFI